MLSILNGMTTRKENEAILLRSKGLFALFQIVLTPPLSVSISSRIPKVVHFPRASPC
jgi:hypothetical protein